MSFEFDNISADKTAKSEGFWVISTDKIFSGEINGFKEFARIINLGFTINEFSITDGPKFSDSVIQAQDVKILMPIGEHIASIQKYLSKRTVMKKILLKRLMMIKNKLSAIDELEFCDAKFMSFSLQNELVTFAFRYHTYSYSFTSYKVDGTKGGTSAMSVDAKWEVK